MATSCDQLNYEYMSEDAIDEELKCVICKQPLQSPVSLSQCNHTFCKECIKQWLCQINTCPTCREDNSNIHSYRTAQVASWHNTAYIEINTKIVLNQLDRLLVRCLLCEKNDIQRCDYQKHEETCTKKVVPCSAADLKCTWKGVRDELPTHLKICAFEQLRSILDELKSNNDTLKNQVNFLLKIINKGNLMTQQCTKPLNECRYGITNTPTEFNCAICNQSVPREDISLHNCGGDCICQACVDAQYSDDEDDQYPYDEYDQSNFYGNEYYADLQ